ncbi:ComEC/Rec2 family competence protein [Nocardiopsis sp. CNT-189]|uniref:ComEC/Rec2 family competence protein n=1 Tax=Nocardiopsis oceanisediminis TaxID=2816862 RepID=UPI003B2B3845
MNLFGTDAPTRERVADVRLAGPALGVWAAAALLGGGSARAALCAAGALLACALLALVPAVRRAGWAAAVAAAALCSATSALACGGRLAAVESSPVAALARTGGELTAEVEVAEVPRPRKGPSFGGGPGFTVPARTVWAAPGEGAGRAAIRVPVVLLVSGEEWRAVLPSERVRVSGPVLPAGPGTVHGLLPVRGPPASTAPPVPAQAWAGGFRDRLRAASAGLPAPADALLPAFVAGDASAVPEETAEDFRAAGMTHLMVVSGSHLALLTGAVLAAGRWLRCPPWPTALAGAGLIGAMVLVAGPGPSVLRAALMGLIALLATALGRDRTGLAALSAAVMVLVLFDPALAVSYGFALSVLASGGIMVLAPGWSRLLAARMPAAAADALAVAAASHLACLPVLVLLRPEVGWVAVPANAVAAPLVPVAMVGGFGTAAAALLWPAGAAAAAWVPGTAVLLIARIADAASGVPFAAVPWRGDAVGAAGLAALVSVLLVVRGRARAALLAVVLSAAATTCAVPAWPPRGWAAVLCDVGQGDAAVLSVAPGRAAVVDTGQDPGPVDRCLSDLGVDGIPLLVLSHGDADHVGGTPGALSGRPVGGALVPDGFDAPAASAALAASGVRPRTAASGDAWTLGPWTLRALWPRPSPGAADPEDGNARSIVLHARWEPPGGGAAAPLTLLLTGDVEESAQRALMSEPLVRGVDVLKTPHHGAGAQDRGFLRATRARAAVTSVGADNRYGHPAPETVRALESLTPAHYRTDLHGDIAVLPGPGGPRIAARGPLGG